MSGCIQDAADHAKEVVQLSRLGKHHMYVFTIGRSKGAIPSRELPACRADAFPSSRNRNPPAL